MSSVTRARWLAGMVGALLLAALIPSAASAATRPITFDLFLADSCIQGSASDNADVKVVWRDESGALEGRATVQSGDLGGWGVCFSDSYHPDHALGIGHRVKATVGSATRTFVVPDITVNPDRVDDLFKGKAPAGTRVRLSYGAPFGDTLTNVTVDVGADGRWLHDPEHDIVGGHQASLRWRSPKDDFVWAFGQAPFVRVTLGSSRFSGVARPDRAVEIVLEDGPTGDVRAIGHAFAGPLGHFRGHFEDQDGRVTVAVGDHLSAPDLASDVDWIVPKVTGRANASMDVVRGRCFDTGTSAGVFQIRVLSPTGNQRGSAIGYAGSDPFEVDFGSGEPDIGFDPANIRSGDTIEVGCQQTTGDRVQKVFVVA